MILQDSDFIKMRETIFSGTQAYSYGRHEDLGSHAKMLKAEFVGKSELELYHALIIVCLRRGIDTKENVQLFYTLWESESDFLLRSLDSRWLVSAADTSMEHGRTSEERAFALAVSAFVNTMKLYETERFALNVGIKDYEPIAGRLALFDGMAGFAIGYGDMVYNLFRRAAMACDTECFVAKIFMEVLNRAKAHDTVFHRFLEVHLDPSTVW